MIEEEEDRRPLCIVDVDEKEWGSSSDGVTLGSG